MTYTVTNIKGNSSRDVLPSGFTSWIDYWEKKTGKKAMFCNCTTCLERATDGAHVNVVGRGNYWYIVPLCRSHNLTSGCFVVEGPLVPVNPNLPILW